MSAPHHPQLTDELREELALHAFGLLEGETARELDGHLKGGCTVCNAEYRALAALMAELPKALTSVTPAPHVKERLLARARAEQEQPDPGIFVMRGSNRKWKATPFAGVSYTALYVDRATGYATTLLKLEAGAKYPAHHHAGVEQTWVLEGSCRIGDVRIAKGDFAYAAAGSDHGVVESEEGCILLIVASQHDEILA